jgi:hypothetical protein
VEWVERNCSLPFFSMLISLPFACFLSVDCTRTWGTQGDFPT